MAKDPLRKKPGAGRPEIWASGGQRPPFDLRALGRAGLHLSRAGVAPILAWAARGLRRLAIGVKDGRGRIPPERLGRAAHLVPSHLRVAGWVKSLAATLAHASATADPDVQRGNALVAEVQPHLWSAASPVAPVASGPSAPALAPGEVAPVVLPEPTILPPGDDPHAAIGEEIAAGPTQDTRAGPDRPPAPPGPVAEGAIQVLGYATGWAAVGVALPYGLGRALWLWAAGRDLRQIGTDD